MCHVHFKFMVCWERWSSQWKMTKHENRGSSTIPLFKCPSIPYWESTVSTWDTWGSKLDMVPDRRGPLLMGEDDIQQAVTWIYASLWFVLRTMNENIGHITCWGPRNKGYVYLGRHPGRSQSPSKRSEKRKPRKKERPFLTQGSKYMSKQLLSLPHT